MLKPTEKAITQALAAAAATYTPADEAQLGMPLPPFNREAATPAEAYPLASLIGKVRPNWSHGGAQCSNLPFCLRQDAYEALRPSFQTFAKATPAEVASWRESFACVRVCARALAVLLTRVCITRAGTRSLCCRPLSSFCGCRSASATTAHGCVRTSCSS